jgi:hypothetical protein
MQIDACSVVVAQWWALGGWWNTKWLIYKSSAYAYVACGWLRLWVWMILTGGWTDFQFFSSASSGCASDPSGFAENGFTTDCTLGVPAPKCTHKSKPKTCPNFGYLGSFSRTFWRPTPRRVSFLAPGTFRDIDSDMVFDILTLIVADTTGMFFFQWLILGIWMTQSVFVILKLPAGNWGLSFIILTVFSLA